jgi:hypothetical protein
MIRISVGNPGSGKTASEVWEMAVNRTRRAVYTNIAVRGLKHVKLLERSMIFSKIPVRTVKHKGGDSEMVYDYKLNVDYWRKAPKPLSIVIDEAHTLLDSRRSMGKLAGVLTDWLALIRRVLGTSEGGTGELVLVSQLSRRIDVIAREMATQIRHHRCHYLKRCSDCGQTWPEHSDIPEPLWACAACGSGRVKKFRHWIEIWCFKSMEDYDIWRSTGKRTFYRHFHNEGIERVFGYYDTLQWDELISEE